MSEDNLRLSVSKVKTFNQCRKQFEFNYILKLPKKDRDYHITGKLCHSVLEWFHQQYIDGCLLPYNITMNDSFKRAILEYKDKLTPEMKKECWDLINKYLMVISNNKKNGKILNILSVERRFEYPLTDKIMLNGAIDRVQLDDDGILHIADYKSSKSMKYLEKDYFQLATYGFIELMNNPNLEKIRVSYIMLKHDCKYITKEFTAKQLLEVRQQFLDYAEEILSEKEYPPTTSVLCGYCDYLDSCEAGKEKVNSDPRQSHKVYGEVNW
jgi:putative RecB family exonuclease